MQLDQIDRSRPAMQFVDILNDHGNFDPLLPCFAFELSQCVVGGVGLLAEDHVTPVLIELPYERGVSREGPCKKVNESLVAAVLIELSYE